MELLQVFKIKGYDQLDLIQISSLNKSVVIRNNKIDNISSGSSEGIGIRAIVNGRVGYSFVNAINNLKNAVDTAIKLAKYSNIELELFSYKKYPRVLNHSNLNNLSEKELIDAVNFAIDFASKNNTKITDGEVSSQIVNVRYINSLGVDLSSKKSIKSASFATNYKDSSGSWSEESMFNKPIEEIAIRESCECSKLASKKSDIPSGKFEVVFHPLSLAPDIGNIIEYGLIPSFNADNVQRGKSRLNIGDKIFSKKLNIIDDGLMKNSFCSTPFDYEGTPTQKTQLVKNGVVKNFLYDLTRAKVGKVKSTGNGFRNYNTLCSISPTNFIISKGTKEVLSQMDKGLLVYAPLSAHSINPVTGNLSLGISEAFWVEKGKIKFAPKQAMLSGNVFDIFGKDFIDVGKDVALHNGLYCPSILTRCNVIGK